MDLRQLEEELKKIGVTVVSGRQDTVITVQIKGLAGKPLERALRLADQLLQERVKRVLKAHTDPATKLFADPTFGPRSDDPVGVAAMCRSGASIPSKGASQHQAKVLSLLKSEKIRWERPEYAATETGDGENSSPNGGDDEDDSAEEASAFSSRGDAVFASEAKLFADGVCSGDVIQGNLGDCWFLSALSVVATRADMLEQTFWRADTYKSKGLFVCKFMKNFVWNYVIIDDRLPVFGFSNTKAGKPYFARCRDPNELWVSMLEKAYAKLHGSYEALIGGFVDVALNDLTGMCSEQVIMKAGFPGFGEDPFATARPGQQPGDPFWEKILRYKSSGTLMGCSIQPPPTGDKNVAAESNAGNGLYYKHAYALIDAAEIKTVRGERVKLIKLRNPWGMGEWTGPWSDSSTERTENQNVIEEFFKILKRSVGGNAQKRIFLRLNGKGEMAVDEIAQEEVVEANANDGTFFMAYSTWMQYFTHFFAGIDFPDAWHGRRVEGCWSETTCGGNTTKSTWINNPHFELTLKERSQVFISLSQEDPRGKDNQKIVPVGFHICSLLPVSGSSPDAAKCEVKEPAKKADAYYRLYKAPKDRADFQNGVRPEPLPPAIIPGSVISGIDDDGVPQPAYTFKQAVSAEATMEPGRYCIIPSMYMRTDKDSGKTNVGSFWISAYVDKRSFKLEGGERIVEEEEGDDSNCSNASGAFTRTGTAPGSALNSPSKNSDTSGVMTESMTLMEKRKKYEDAKDEILRQAKMKGIGIRELKMEFAKASILKRADCRRKMQSLGFKVDDLNDEVLNALLSGLEDGGSGNIMADKLVGLFEHEIGEDQMACEVPEIEDDDAPEKLHQEGILQIQLHGATDLVFDQKLRSAASRKISFPALTFDDRERAVRRKLAASILEENPNLANSLRRLSFASDLLSHSNAASHQGLQGVASFTTRSSTSTPIGDFYSLLESRYDTLRRDNSTDAGREATTPSLPSQPIFAIRMPPPVPQGDATLLPQEHRAEALHATKQMQELEKRRAEKLVRLQRLKQKALGDIQQTMALPRLIGGRKSGSSYGQCVDCGERVPINGRTANSSNATETFICAGSSCVNVFCHECYIALPQKSKLCSDCFANERIPSVVLGERLRVVLIDKIGKSESQRTRLEELFHEFDVDQSGKLSYEEFSRALAQLRIQPPLTQEQTRFLLNQFDTNGDGEVSFAEFTSWILHDHMWDSSLGDKTAATAGIDDVANSIVIPLRDEIIDAAFSAFSRSSSILTWTYTVHSLIEKPTIVTVASVKQPAPLFQRVLVVRGDEDRTSAIQRIFERFDADHTGEMDSNEFIAFLASFGVQAEPEDVLILMNRVQSNPVASRDRPSLTLEALTSFVDRLASRSSLYGNYSPHQGRYVPALITRLYKAVEADASTRDSLLSLLRQLSWNMSPNDAQHLSHRLRRQLSILLEPDQILRLAKAVCFEDEFVSVADPSTSISSSESGATRTVLRRSCDILLEMLLSNSYGLAAAMTFFDLSAVSQQLASIVGANFAASSMSSIWQRTFGADVASPIDQRSFIARLVTLGALPLEIQGLHMEGGDDQRRMVAKLFVSFALDALRLELRGPTTRGASDGDVTFALMSLLLRYPQIVEMERAWAQGLSSLIRFSYGEQRYLVTIAVDDSRSLIVRATDPVFKTVADFLLRPDDYMYKSIATHLPQLMRELGVDSSQPTSGMLVTSALHPALHTSLESLIARLRVSTIAPASTGIGNTFAAPLVPFLTLVESDEFVAALRGMLTEIALPFFWSVAHEFLDFSIDIDCLIAKSPQTTGTPSFVQLVVDMLSKHRTTSAPGRAFYSVMLNTSSSLTVRFNVIGTKNRVVMSWEEFQASLAGLQDMYAVVQLRPQDEIFSTSVVPAGAVGAATWNFEQAVLLKEPEACNLRIDRPVVYTDTVKVVNIEGLNGVNTADSPRVSFVDANDKGPAHFVIVTVRKAVASTGDSPAGGGRHPRLYCTAYDPLTSCDYAVEGYPEDWSLDFFNAAMNPDFEVEWRAMLRKMRLGISLTPTLAIKVFSKQPKADQLVGECEITVASAIARDGHLFHEIAALKHPTKPDLTTGRVQLTFSFDATKASDAIVAASSSTTTRPRRISRVVAPAAPVNLVVPQDNSLQLQQEFDGKLKDLRSQLQSAEQARADANEYVKTLKRQLQPATTVSNLALNEEAARWKRGLEQALRDQAILQEEKDKKLAQLQEKLKWMAQQLAAQEAELAKPPPGPATNLKQAALGEDASAHDLLSAMKEILVARCPERPYNGLKKALAAVAEVPGKVAVAAFEDVLSDYGLAVTVSHRSALYSVLDAESRGLVFIEDFFIKLCGDAEAYSTIVQVRQRASPPPPQLEEIATPPVSVVEPASPTAPAPTRVRKLNWREMKKFLILNLPDGWETRFTEKGRPYFCNHANRSTQWKHPRPEIEAMYSEWMQENGANFSRSMSSSATSQRRA